MKSLREILLRKSMDDRVKELLIKINDDQLKNIVEEVLEKMAAKMALNASFRDFYDHLSPRDIMALRADLGHHAAHYKHFLDKGDTENANKHAEQFLKLGHIAYRLNDYSKRLGDGKFDFDAPDIKAWQKSRGHDIFLGTSKDGGTRDDIPGWRAHFPNKRRGPDRNNHHLWLNEPPHNVWHPSLLANPGKDAQGNNVYHDSAYPMEHLKINGKYINVSPVTDEPTGYTKHVFDNHPGVAWAFNEPESSHTGPQAAKYQDQLANFNDTHRDALVNSLRDANAKHDGTTVGPRIHSTSKRVDLAGEPQPSPAADVSSIIAGIHGRAKETGSLNPADHHLLAGLLNLHPNDISFRDGQIITSKSSVAPTANTVKMPPKPQE